LREVSAGRDRSVSVLVANEPAIGLYRKHGFVEEGRRVCEIKLGPAEYADDLIMYRLLKWDPSRGRATHAAPHPRPHRDG
jgi:ribosomal protein S18 acetylase RimI-like enzyme